MRILVVEFSPAGGLYHYALQLAEGLAGAGHDVVLLTGRRPELVPDATSGLRLAAVLPTWDPTPRRGEATLRRKGRRLARAVLRVLAWRAVARHVRRDPPDVIQLGNLQFLMDGWWASRLARRRSGPAVAVIAHTPRPLDWGSRRGALHRRAPLLHRTLGSAYRQVDAVLVLGENSRAELLSAFPGTRRTEVVPHGAGGRFAGDRPAPAGDLPPRVLFFGTWARYKGIDVLLEAFGQVREQLPEAELVLAGAVAKDVDLAAVTARAQAIGGVSVRPDYVPAPQVRQLVVDARVVTAPYLTANQSGVVHLAQALGRPVVATRVGDLPDVVADGVNGLLVPPGDADALAAAVLRLLRDPEVATAMGEAAFRTAAAVSWETVADAVLEVYTSLDHGRRVNA